MTVRMRHTRAHTGNRRSHHSLKDAATTSCDYCKQPKLKHVVCTNCGRFKGVVVINMESKKTAKKAKTSN